MDSKRQRQLEEFFFQGQLWAITLMWQARSKPNSVQTTAWQRDVGFKHWHNAKQYILENSHHWYVYGGNNDAL